jgi:ABC-2 type transport system ATP-binding protein
VGIIREGRLVAVQSVEELFAQRMNRMSLIFDALPPPDAFAFPGVAEKRRGRQTVELEVRHNLPQVLAAAAQHNVMDIETHNVSLEEIFLAYYSAENGGYHA